MNTSNIDRLSPAKLNDDNRAFTLIELLTVIAIIGILAAILIPVVGSVRNSAKAAQCISNMRQLGSATYLFLSDHNDRFFPRLDSSRLTVLGKTGTWRTTAADRRPLNPYLDINGPDDPLEVLHCPQDDGSRIVAANNQSVYDATGSSYHANVHGSHGQIGLNHKGHIPIHMSEIIDPSRFVIFAEDPAIANAFASPDYQWSFHSENEPSFNLLFGDGHVGKHVVRTGARHAVDYSFYRNPADAPAVPTIPTR